MSTVAPVFGDDSWAFLTDLAANNTRDYFAQNRARYDGHIAGPSRALVNSLSTSLPNALGVAVNVEAKVGRSLFRFNRDTRFVQDKTPYNTHLDFLFWIGSGAPRQSPAFILRLTATTTLVGAGQIGLRGDEVAAYREALVNPTTGSRARDIVDRLLAGGAELSAPSRSRPPVGIDADHPNADLLRRDGFHVTRTGTHPSIATPDQHATWICVALRPYTPLVRWLNDPYE